MYSGTEKIICLSTRAPILKSEDICGFQLFKIIF
jgi:hypothetical protein